MTPVVFVAPFFAETTLRFVEAAAGLSGVRLGLLSQDPVDAIHALEALKARRMFRAQYTTNAQSAYHTRTSPIQSR